MDYRTIFDSYEEKIPQIEEVDKAEENARKIYVRIAVYDSELADSVDMIMGTLARAYEAQGFGGDFMCAKDLFL